MKVPTALPVALLWLLVVVVGSQASSTLQGQLTTASRQQRAQPTLVNGTYISEGTDSKNYFDNETLTTLDLSVPTGYGNAASSNDIPVQDWVEFGWQNTDPPALVSVDINETATGYNINWKEDVCSFCGRGGIATVTLTSSSFLGCTINMTSNNFPDPVNQTLSGNTITLTTPAAVTVRPGG
jgi:hypothetical protein